MENKASILIIEDDSYIGELYEEILKSQGYVVTIASDGEVGLQKAHEGGYSLILLDMMLPKKNGIDILTALKNNPPKTKNGKIILITNLNQESVIKEGLNLGASSYLIKSDLTPDQFINKVKTFLQ